MKRRDHRMAVVWLGILLSVSIPKSTVRADFTFGEPMNLGPAVNSEAKESQPCISADGLSLLFVSDRPGTLGGTDIWMTTRPTQDAPWAEPENLGSAVNSAGDEWGPFIAVDGLELYFHAERPDGYGATDIWVATRETRSEPWTGPVNLGPPVCGADFENSPCITADGLELFFTAYRPGGLGDLDIWVARRATREDPWGEPVNLGPTVNSSARDRLTSVSSDGLTLLFGSQRPSGYGNSDIWMTRRPSVSDDWEPAVNLAPPVNTEYGEDGPSISADGSTLYFHSGRPGGAGRTDLWQVPIIPLCDFNLDAAVDALDALVMMENWGIVRGRGGPKTTLCDIAPLPFGDGIVDAQDLFVLAEHMIRDNEDVQNVDDVQ